MRIGEVESQAGVASLRRPVAAAIGILTLLALLAGIAALPPPAGAKTFVVNKRGDPPPGKCTKDHCTLREAVIRANKLAGDDRIELPTVGPYLLKRDSSLPVPDREKGDLNIGNGINELGNALTIVRPGSGRAVIDAADANDRVIRLAGTATLRKLVLRNGSPPGVGDGGAIHSSGHLTLVKTRIAGNTAGDLGGGIYAPLGLVSIRQTKIAGNSAVEGGGIYIADAARATVLRSTVARNAAFHGGGAYIDSAGTASRIIASTFNHNDANGRGGAIHNADRMLIVNSTLAHNLANQDGGGLYAAPDSDARLNAVTMARNRANANDVGPHSGGGVYADGGADVVRIQNSLLARNRATNGDPQDCFMPAPLGVDSLGGNLVTTLAGPVHACFTHPQDIVDDQPRIDQLAQNGGPTRTIALRPASPAINQAKGPSPPKRDQRGVTRVNPDIGAFELK